MGKCRNRQRLLFIYAFGRTRVMVPLLPSLQRDCATCLARQRRQLHAKNLNKGRTQQYQHQRRKYAEYQRVNSTAIPDRLFQRPACRWPLAARRSSATAWSTPRRSRQRPTCRAWRPHWAPAKVREECADRKAKKVADMARQLAQYVTGLSEGWQVLAGIDILCSTRELNNSYRLYRIIM